MTLVSRKMYIDKIADIVNGHIVISCQIRQIKSNTTIHIKESLK